jgi:prolyl oligopeptidase
MREHKQNTFDDFIAAAEWLIAERYTRAQKLAVTGGSNGGLLVGALLTQRPELVRAVVCSYPLLDMLRYHRFLMGSYWVPEYGSADEPGEFRWLYGYSPYHRVREGLAYPAVLFITGDGDTRVAPLHARKMAARLQALAPPGTPVFLRYETKAGHAGGQPLSQQIEDYVEAYSFLAWRLGEG